MQNLMPPVDTPDKAFHDGNPLTGELGTIVTALFMNNLQAAIRNVQAEVISVLADAGIAIDPNKTDQLLAALKATFATNVNVNGRVPVTRKVNGKALTADITLGAGDVGALPASGTAAAATKLATQRKINGTAFDGSADISVDSEWSQIKNVPAASSDVAGVVTLGSGVNDNSRTVAATTQLVFLARALASSALVKANAALPADGTAVAANKLATPRTIAGVPFDGTENIVLTADRVGALPVGGMAVEAVKAHWLAEPRKINGVPFDGKADITLPQDFPVGVPIPYPLSIPPVGWIKCNGQSFNKNLYTILASIYPSGVLPDLRGEFVRGWDDGRGVDSGRALLSLQSDEFKSHAHGNVPLYRYPSGDSDRGVGNFSWFSVDDLGITETAGGNETRPRNIAFNYIVRAA
ncbi:hypothetical protein PEC301879_05440 [Pectobacterium carotovorum subsp. carotovorum]|nr:hypothetical protein PEC301879_05440 [Pectobacterium carotovorum subsp. carotovorum]